MTIRNQKSNIEGSEEKSLMAQDLQGVKDLKPFVTVFLLNYIAFHNQHLKSAFHTGMG